MITKHAKDKFGVQIAQRADRREPRPDGIRLAYPALAELEETAAKLRGGR